MPIQTSIGELIAAMYDDLLETYGDEEVALAGAQAVGNDLLNPRASAVARPRPSFARRVTNTFPRVAPRAAARRRPARATKRIG